MSSSRPRFDLDALRARAGDRVFARGQAYYADGLVDLLVVEPGRVLAQVAGTEDYRTELDGHGEDIAGRCSCPAFEDAGFCKHMVAAALAANAAGDSPAAEAVGALSRIREHLLQQGIEPLVELIVGLAEGDPGLFRKLDMAAAMSGGDADALATSLRLATDRVTRIRDFVAYNEVRGWAAEVEDVLDGIADLVPAGHAAQALALAGYAFDRIELAMASIDDSNGEGGALLGHAVEIHLAAALAARPEPVQLAGELFEREMEDGYGVFDGAARLYADALGQTGLAEYRRLATAAWEKLPPRSARDHSTFDGRYQQLIGMLDFFAEREGDVDARIALQAKDLSSPWQYLRLAEFCLAHGRPDEALRRAQEGVWMFEDGQPDERLIQFTADLLVQAGRNGDAGKVLWQAFKKAPSLNLYAQLGKVAGDVERGRAIDWLRARLTTEKPGPWHRPADLLVAILAHDGAFDAAWAAVTDHGASAEAREALARASETTHPRQAVDVYAERIDRLVNGGGNSGYAEAAKLLARMARLRTSEAQHDHVEALKLRFARKRNFIKLLG